MKKMIDSLMSFLSKIIKPEFWNRILVTREQSNSNNKGILSLTTTRVPASPASSPMTLKMRSPPRQLLTTKARPCNSFTHRSTIHIILTSNSQLLPMPSQNTIITLSANLLATCQPLWYLQDSTIILVVLRYSTQSSKVHQHQHHRLTTLPTCKI